MVFTNSFVFNNIIRKTFVNTYKSLSLTRKPKHNLEVPRHFSPANKEWNDSVYSYNKMYVKSLPVTDQKSSLLIKNFFSFLPFLKKGRKSWRMRTFNRRKSTKRIFVSKAEIKQTPDKAIITVYVYDREKHLFSKKLYLLRESLLKVNSLSANFFKKEPFLTNKIADKAKGLLTIKLNRLKRLESSDPLYKKFILKKQMHKHRVRPALYARNIILSIYKNKTFLKNLFFFFFMKWVLSIFNLRVGLKNKFLITKVKSKIATGKYLNIKNKALSLKKLRKINIILLQSLLAQLNKIAMKNKNKSLNLLFTEFKNKYFAKFMKKYLTKIVFALKTLSRFNSTKHRYTTLIDGLKNIVASLYNRKIELNIVNSKYIHMNSDNFTEAVTTKLKRNKGRLLKVLKKSLTLIKKPLKFSVILDNSKAIKKKPNNIKSVLNSIMYKWVTGVRLEARGRLTRRYIASRAVYKFKYKGNLRNLEHLHDPSQLDNCESISLHYLRNQFRPNVQHSFAHSKKRIGSFGIKGWISSV